MYTYYIFKSDFPADELEIIMDILPRMGWAYDEDEEDSNRLIINVPIDDGEMLEYIVGYIVHK